MNRHYDAAIFDMDGTLLDSMRYWRYTTLEYLLAHRLPVKPEDLLVMQDTSSRKLLFDIAERDGFEIGTRKEVVTELEGFMHRHYQYDTQLKNDNVPELLQRLKDNGMKLCVATAAPREYACTAFKRLGILDCFEFVTDIYEFDMEKSNPEYFGVVARRLGTVPERCVVFEDALYAMESAKAAGCAVVAIEDITARKQKDRIAEVADVYVKDYSELWMKAGRKQ